MRKSTAVLRDLKLKKLKRLKRKKLKRSRFKLNNYYPDAGEFRRELYVKHNAFFEAGVTFRERCAMAANRVGKTEGMGGFELTLHLTGRYPHWWLGRRFEGPIKAWAAGDTNETVRDIIQAKLLGKFNEIGTGLIPGDDIVKFTRRSGLPEAVQDIYVRHATGGVSIVTLKSYEQGRKKFQGTEQDVIWLDEEPPQDIYSECLMRTMTTGGMVMLTFTPLSGMSEVVLSYMQDKDSIKTGVITKALIQAGWDDVPHLSESDKDELKVGLPSHEIQARSKGTPTLGSGAVFPISEENIKIDPFPLPDHWPVIVGLDFGWDHPTAASKLVWDRDNDIVYVVAEHRQAQQSSLFQAAEIKAKFGAWPPVAWPHDGLQHDKGSGEQLAIQYRDHGLNMLDEKATFEEGGNSVEAGLLDMLDRMQSGRWKVFSTCSMWFDEFRIYHRKDGKLVKLRDDLMSSSRYALMMLREAKVKPRNTQRKTNQAKLPYKQGRY